MNIWKLSMGTNEIGDDYYRNLIKNNRVTVHPQTSAKAQSSKTQGENFIEARSGDLFFVCRSNNFIELIGMFKDNVLLEPLGEEYKNNGWKDRSFVTIYSAAENRDKYNKNFTDSNGIKPWWHPGDNSTFIEVKDLNLFEKEILQPVFNKGLQELEGEIVSAILIELS